LSSDEQTHILGWLEEVMGRIRVVSTTGVPVWPLVQAGQFNEDLYYRLNMVFVDMGTS
jgi:transcriptional regulator with PAS, ATPase and Fis domain